MPAVTAGSPKRRGSYGVDAPKVPVLMIAGATAAGVAGLIVSAPGLVLAAALLLLNGASFLYATRTGKFAVWERLFRHLGMRGDEHVVDIGCGRGARASQSGAARAGGTRPRGDLWRSVDQSGNSEAVTRHGHCRTACGQVCRPRPFPRRQEQGDGLTWSR